MKGKKRRRILSLVMSLCMVLSLLITNSSMVYAEDVFGTLEFQSGTKVTEQNAVSFTIDEKDYVVSITPVEDSEWGTHGENAEWRNIKSGSELVFTLTMPEGVETVPKLMIDGARESFVKNAEGVYTYSKTFNFEEDNFFNIQLEGGQGSAGGGDVFGTFEFQGGTNVDGRNAVSFTIDDKAYVVEITEVEGSTWETNTNGNAEWRNIKSGSNLVFTLTMPEGATTVPKLMIGGDSETFAKNEETGEYTYSRVFNFAQDNNFYNIGLQTDGGSNNPPAGGGDVFGTLEFPGGTKVEDQNAVSFRIDEKDYVVEITKVEDSTWETNTNGNAEWSNIKSGSNLVFTLTMPEGATTVPDFMIDGARETFAQNEETGKYTYSKGFDFTQKNRISIQLELGGGQGGGPQVSQASGPISYHVIGDTNADKISNPVCKIGEETENLSPVWPEAGVVTYSLQVEDGYEIVPSTLDICWEFEDPDNSEEPGGVRLELSSELQTAIVEGLVSSEGYTFSKELDVFKLEKALISLDQNPRMRIEFAVNKKFDNTIPVHFYTQDPEGYNEQGQIEYREVEPVESADDMHLEEFTFNGNALVINNGTANAGGYIGEGNTNKLTFFEGFGTKIDAVYVSRGDVKNPSSMTKVEPVSTDPAARYEIDVPGVEYSILVVYGLSDDVNLKWSYLEQYSGEDFFVENGTVEVTQVVRGEDVIYPYPDGQEPQCAVDVSEFGGEVFVKRGDKVTLKLIPNAGYQLTSASLNGSQLKAQENVSTFEVTVNGNLHFAGAFDEAVDSVEEQSDSLEGAQIMLSYDEENPEADMSVIDSGTLGLTIEDNNSYENKDNALNEAGVGAEEVAVIDMGLENLISKGVNDPEGSKNDNYWVTELTELRKPVVVEADLGPDENLGLEDDEYITVVREHNGTDLENIGGWSWVDEDTGHRIVAITTDKFSTYTIAKVQETKVSLSPSKHVFTEMTPATPLRATVTPVGAIDTNALVWMTYDDGVVTVDDNGRITPVANGITTVACGIQHGNGEIEILAEATIEVNVGLETTSGESVKESDTSGKISTETKVDSVAKNVISVSDFTVSDVKKVLNEYESQDVSVGVDAKLSLYVESRSGNDVPDDIKTGIQSEITAMADDATIAMYFDMSLFKTLETGEGSHTERVADMEGGKITVTVAVPDDLPPVADGSTRHFFLVQNHEYWDDVEGDFVSERFIVNSNYNPNTKKLTADVDKFSLFGLGYYDTIDVTNVSLNKTSATLTKKDETVQLSANVEPANASVKDVTWTSSNPSVATVDNNGKVTAVARGTATITATSVDGNKTASCIVDVNIPATDETQEMYRLYNPNSGEHFYTAALAEKNYLVSVGWNYEGIAWYAPKTGDPVYRLYNPNAGDHHYTVSKAEKDYLVSVGWNYEGIAWYSGGSTPLYRAYNPNAKSGAHHYSTNRAEIDYIVSVGWNDEGIGWYGVK